MFALNRSKLAARRATARAHKGRNTMLVRIFCTAALAFGLMSSAPAQAQDKAAPKPATKVLLDNDKVLVTQTTIPPGAVNKSNRKDRTNYIVKGRSSSAPLRRARSPSTYARLARRTGSRPIRTR